MSRSFKNNPGYGPNGRAGRHGETHRSDSRRNQADKTARNIRQRRNNRVEAEAGLDEHTAS